jgi:Uma2 family endonuclease
MRAPQLNLLDLELPIVLSPAAPVTDDKLMRFSRQNRPYKIERTKEGELKIMTPVGGIGSSHEEYVSGEFYIWTKQNGTGKSFSPSCGFNLPDRSCLSPDVAWISFERWNALSLKQQTGFPPLCPEFVIEIRSASDSRRVLEAKMQSWLDNGVRLAWLIDPVDKNVVIYRPDEVFEILDRPDTVVASGPVAGFALDCTPLWSTR